MNCERNINKPSGNSSEFSVLNYVAHTLTTGIYSYHWYIQLPLAHTVTTGTYSYHWHIQLPLVPKCYI